MELWIRSQDKEKLLKCNDIAIAADSEDGKTIRGYKIVGYFDKNTEYEELGFYASRIRALEVLDDIQNYMRKSAFVKKINGLGNELDLIPMPILVYEMPEK